MVVSRMQRYGLVSVVVYAAFYYLWLIYMRNDVASYSYLLVGNVLSTLAPFLATALFVYGWTKSYQSEKLFWLLLAFGSFNYFIAELIWIYQENIIKIEVPFPGIADLFYLLQIGFYFFAFFYLSFKDRSTVFAWSNLFNIAIIMVVATTFSWYYLIRSMVDVSDRNPIFLFVTIGYPVGDLALHFIALSLLLSVEQKKSKAPLIILSIGLLLQVVSDSVYSYLQVTDNYASGSWIDPLSSLAFLLMGYASFFQEPNRALIKRNGAKIRRIPKIKYGRMALTYISILLLVSFLIVESYQVNSILIGSSMAIILVIVRQVVAIIENNRLLHHISEKAIEHETSRYRYQSLFQYHPDAVCSLDLEGRFVTANDACARFTKIPNDKLIGRTVFSLMNKEAALIVKNHFERVLGGDPCHFELEIEQQSGDVFWMDITFIPIITHDGVSGIYGIGKDITVNKLNEKRIEYLAYHDSLTGLLNRLYFNKVLTEALQRASEKKHMVALFYMDLDRFKEINDTLGHDAGDALLIAVANRMKEALKGKATIARQGGDEFTILAEGITSLEESANLAQTLLDLFKDPFTFNGHESTISPSIGISIYPDNADSGMTLMKYADKAMYRVKEQGKNNYFLFNSDRKAN